MIIEIIRINRQDGLLCDLDNTLIDSERQKEDFFHQALAAATETSGITEHQFTFVAGRSTTQPILEWINELGQASPSKTC